MTSKKVKKVKCDDVFVNDWNLNFTEGLQSCRRSKVNVKADGWKQRSRKAGSCTNLCECSGIIISSSSRSRSRSRRISRSSSSSSRISGSKIKKQNKTVKVLNYI